MKGTKYAEIELENPFTHDVITVLVRIAWTYSPSTELDDSYIDCEATAESFRDIDGNRISQPDWFDENMIWPEVRELAAEDFYDS